MRTTRIQEAEQCGRRRRRWGPLLSAAVLVAVMSMTLAGPALAAGPTVTNLIPRNGTHLGGTSVTILGSSFSGATAVKFGSTNARSFTVRSPTEIIAVSPGQEEPIGPVVVDVTVTTPEGTSPTSEADRFKYIGECQEGHAPAVTSISPTSGSAGTSVLIKGERFFQVVCTSEGFSVNRVLFGTQEATFKGGEHEGEIIATTPPGCGTVDITVESGLGQSPLTPSDQFIYSPCTSPPTVTHVEPNHGAPQGGTSVTITGTGFTGATAVKFGSANATTFTVNSDTSITAVSPKGKGTINVTVSTPVGTSSTSAADQFTFSKK
jgi:hypothetical protein